MKKFIVVLVVLMLVVASLEAQGYAYNPSNTPTSGSANGWPFTVSYPAWRFSFIVDAKVLPTAPVKFTELAFVFSGGGTKNAKQLQIRVGHTTHKNYSGAGATADFDTMLGPCPTIVYDGPLTSWTVAGSKWEDIGLQRTFAYDGKRNVVIDLRYQGGSGGLSVRVDASIARAYISTQRTPDPYNSKKWYVPIHGEMQGPKTRLTYVKDHMVFAPDTVSIGATAPITYVAGVAGDTYLLAASLGQTRLQLPGGSIFLTPDNVFIYSATSGFPVFNKYLGVLDASGNATAKFVVPRIPALIGYCVYHAGISIRRGTTIGYTNTDGTEITK